jgi:hypothetical protein
LGHLIEHSWIKPLHPQIKTDNLQTLNDFQKLLGDIIWIWPTLQLTTEDLKPLFGILRGDTDLSSPRMLTSATKRVLQIISGTSPDPSYLGGPC